MSFRRTAALIGIAALWTVTGAQAQTPPAPTPAPAPPPGTTPPGTTPATPEDAAAPAAPAPAAVAPAEPAAIAPAAPAPAEATVTPAAPVEPPKPAAPAAPSTPTVSKWKVNIYGMVEFNAMHDSTQSFGESVGGSALRRMDSYQGSNGRMHFTSRNSRLGFKVNAPDFGDIKTSGVLEMDFFGFQGSPSEASFVSNGTFRMRQAFIKVETPYADLLVGQTYHVWGWQPFFFPATTSFFPIMNMVFGRMPQVRVSRTIKTDAVNVDVALAAVKPPQRDSEVPDAQGGLKLGFNGWKGVHSLGAGTMLHDALSIGVSGIYRHFRVGELTAAPVNSRSTDGYGISLDAFVPVIPAASVEDAGNALSLTGSFSASRGVADVLGVHQVGFPTVTNAAGASVAYPANIDPGLVRFDASGQVHAIPWTTFMVGLQYYLPPSGSVLFSANYTQSESKGITAANGFTAERGFPGNTYNKGRYIDGNLLIDFTKAFRLGLSYQYSWQRFTDGATANNHRKEISAYMFF